MPAVIQPVSPGSPAYGIGYKPVTVVKVDTATRIAITRDSYGQFEEVRCDLMKAKGNLPAPGEQWIIDRPYGQWMFGAIITGSTDGVVIPPENVTGLNDTLIAADTRVTNVADASLSRDNVLGGRATTLETNTTSQAVAKGDILAAPAAGTLNRLAVGAANTVLTPDATTPTGLAYKAPLALVTPLTGATATGRYVGQTSTAAAPTTGTFVVGDWVRDVNGLVWVCSVAGTPGTWVSGANSRLTTAESNISANSTSITNNSTNITNNYNALRGSGKHIWYCDTSPQLDGGGGDLLLTTWTQYYSDGIAALGAGNGLFQFRTAGKWALMATVDSDAGTFGNMNVWVVPGNPAPWGPAANGWLINRAYRGSGSAGAGYLSQSVNWTGRVAVADKDQAFALHVRWYCNTAAMQNCTMNYRMMLEYLGPI